jgi:hypothetical protein
VAFWGRTNPAQHSRCRNNRIWYVALLPTVDIKLSSRYLGIALYTYHKYLKAVTSTVPLDAHGNPIEEEPLVGDGHLELDETDHLAARMSMSRHRRDEVRGRLFRCSFVFELNLLTGRNVHVG